MRPPLRPIPQQTTLPLLRVQTVHLFKRLVHHAGRERLTRPLSTQQRNKHTMPITFQNHTFPPATAFASVNDINAAISTTIQMTGSSSQRKLASLVLNIPFGKRGSTGIRSTAKGHGARWDGTEWTLPVRAMTPTTCEWFRANG